MVKTSLFSYGVNDFMSEMLVAPFSELKNAAIVVGGVVKERDLFFV